jgi:1,2-phenylacetyl-CoA epoxidase PaaB subunit
MYFDPMEDKVYRHPTFYELPESVNHMWAEGAMAACCRSLR